MAISANDRDKWKVFAGVLHDAGAITKAQYQKVLAFIDQLPHNN